MKAKVSKSPDRHRKNITSYAWSPCDLYCSKQPAQKASGETGGGAMLFVKEISF